MVLTVIWCNWSCQNQSMNNIKGMYHQMSRQSGDMGAFSRFFRGPGVSLVPAWGPVGDHRGCWAW